MADDRHDHRGYEPPEISDVDVAEDREFAVAPGDGGSPLTPSN